MEKLLSIVVPTYNMEKFLDRCLSSLIVKKNLDLLEVLVIIDGATDSSSAIAHHYQENYPLTFKVVDKENGNYGSCINRGLKEATGKYIKILDADDFFDTEVLENYMDFLEKQDADMILSDWCLVNSDGICTYQYHYPFKSSQSYRLKDMSQSMDLRMHGITYKTLCVRSINYHQTEGISYTDSEWCFMPMSAISSIAYFDKCLYMYLVGREGQTVDAKVHAKKYWMEVQILERMLQQYLDNESHWSDETRQYMLASLIGRVKIVYEKVLVEYHGCYSLEKLKVFDKILVSKVPDSVIYTNSFVLYDKLPIHYVKVWRKKYNFNPLPLKVLRLYFLLKSKL